MTQLTVRQTLLYQTVARTGNPRGAPSNSMMANWYCTYAKMRGIISEIWPCQCLSGSNQCLSSVVGINSGTLQVWSLLLAENSANIVLLFESSKSYCLRRDHTWANQLCQSVWIPDTAILHQRGMELFGVLLKMTQPDHWRWVQATGTLAGMGLFLLMKKLLFDSSHQTSKPIKHWSLLISLAPKVMMVVSLFSCLSFTIPSILFHHVSFRIQKVNNVKNSDSSCLSESSKYAYDW